MYRDYAQVAREEGYTQLAAAFELVSRVEKEHEERYNALTEHLDSGTLYKRGEKKVWICRYCGRVDKTTAFSSYGGRGSVNLGTCKICDRKPVSERRFIQK